MIFLWILSAALLLGLLLSFICFMLVCYVPRRRKSDAFPVPPGKAYEPYHAAMIEGMKQFRSEVKKVYTIRSFDGLTLSGRYYEFAPGAPVELMFHGYRGTAERDLCVGFQRCAALGRNALIVDQRTSGESEGRLITFGIREHRDCLSWVDFAVKEFGPEVPIILTGISMGASTVLMAAGEELPANVKGVLADCGFTSAREIILSVCRTLHVPGKLIYPLVYWGARIFGRFDLESNSPIEAVKHCCVPVIFIHGEDDAFVPCCMSRENYEACASQKAILTVPGAVHGISYLVDPDTYVQTLADFWNRNGVPTILQKIPN